MGLFRAVRTLVSEFLSFGNEEVNNLKYQLEKQRAQLQQLKVVREQRQKQEEKLALLELRRVVEQMQNIETDRPAQEAEIVEAVGKLGDKMQRVMENEMEGRAVGLMQSIDFQEVLTGIPPEKLDPPGTPLNSNTELPSPVSPTPAAEANGAKPILKTRAKKGTKSPKKK